MRITKLLMVATGTYNDQYLRPFASQMDGHIVQQFQELTQGGADVSAMALSGVAGNLIKPAAVPIGQVQIANGWDTRRFRFLMEVETQAGYGGAVCREVLTGYTDHTGATLSGHIDPMMRIYVNNVISLRTTIVMGPNGREAVTSVSDSSHVLFSGYGNAPYGIPGNSMYTMRPEDVMNAMSAETVTGDVTDTRTVFLRGPRRSRRTNGLAPDYVSRMIQGLHYAFSDPDAFSATAGDIYMNARDKVRDEIASRDPFLGKLMRETSYTENGFITYGELCRMQPETDHVCHAVLPGKTQQVGQAQTFERGQGEFWHVSTPEAVIATALSHSVPALMMDLMITQVEFAATNQTMEPGFTVMMHHIAGFTDGIDMTPYLQRFIEHLKVKILQDLTNNNMLDFNLHMRVDVLGETFISVQVGSNPAVPFVTPSFCDALITPMMTNNQSHLQMVAHDIGTLYSAAGSSNIQNALANARGQTQPQGQPWPVTGGANNASIITSV